MKLILHIGTNKTGSSALQTHMAINRDELLRQGFWFVESEADEKMLNSQISAGNGVNLVKFLHDEDYKGLLNYLTKIKKRAEINGVKDIILSNEVIIRLFSNKKIISLLESVCQKVGFEKVACICVLREPISHALSLYKHRAKKGKWVDYKKWFENNYETLNLFEQFLNHYKVFKFDWIFIEYSINNIEFINRFYEKGIKIELTDKFKALPIRVNKSLKLNNIQFIQMLTHTFPSLKNTFYKELKKSKYNDIENPFLVKKFNDVASSYFSDYSKIIDCMGKLVDKNEWLSKKMIKTSTVDNNILLTQDHIFYIEYLFKKIPFLLFKEKVVLIKSSMANILSNLNQSKFNSQRYGGNIKF